MILNRKCCSKKLISTFYNLLNSLKKYVYLYMGSVQETILTQNEGKKISLSTVQSNVFFPGKYGGAVERPVGDSGAVGAGCGARPC